MNRAGSTITASGSIWLSAGEIARAIAAGHMTSRDVVEAHIRRIDAVNGRLRAVVWPMFDSARAAADAADARHRRGESLGPLDGVPITIKEQFHVAGTPSTIGLPRLANEMIADDGWLAACLRRAGAVVLGKTNVPQLMLFHESENPLYGRTDNPWNLSRGPGGSSGGEAAIIAAGGSPLGFGSDMGGSIRQPAHSCGIHGIMPTAGRYTMRGTRRAFDGMTAISVQPGPLARSVDDLEMALRVMALQVEDEAPTVDDGEAFDRPLGDSAKVDVAQLRIGYFDDDQFFAPSPAIRRAVCEGAEALRSLGATVIPWNPPDVGVATRLYFGLVGADGGASLRRLLGSDPCDWRIREILRYGRHSEWLRRLLAAPLRWFGERRSADLVEHGGRISVDRYWRLIDEQKEYQQRFFAATQRVPDSERIDAILFPPHALPALTHGASSQLHSAGSYCYLPNLLGLPAGVVAATRVRAGEESDRPASRDRSDRMAANVERESVGLPVGVQVAARPWREDLVLAVMRALETHFRAGADYPLRPPLE